MNGFHQKENGKEKEGDVPNLTIVKRRGNSTTIDRKYNF